MAPKIAIVYVSLSFFMQLSELRAGIDEKGGERGESFNPSIRAQYRDMHMYMHEEVASTLTGHDS